jgi:hypothetical protein
VSCNMCESSEVSAFAASRLKPGLRLILYVVLYYICQFFGSKFLNVPVVRHSVDFESTQLGNRVFYI